MEKTYISIQASLTVTVIVGLFFIVLGYLNTRKISNNKSYIVGDRDENAFSLTASLTASALGAWILFGPASAATWGGIGAVIGYSLNDTIVVFDRIRENFRKMRKGTIVDIMNSAINQTLRRTLLTSLTTLLVVVTLILLGGEIIKGFAVALFIGILVGTYSSIFVASPVVLGLRITRDDMVLPAKEGEEADSLP